MSLPEFLRHRMDAVKLYLNTKLEETINRIPGHPILSSKNDSQSSSDDDPFSLVSHFESILVELQALLVWDNPANSAFALTFFTVFYWVLAWLHPSILTCTALLGFCYHSYEMWIRYVWPAIRVPELDNEENERWTKMNMNALTAPEIEHYIERTKLAFFGAIIRLSNLRAESHGKFCGVLVSVFTIIYFVTRNIPGVLLLYGIAITIFLTPGVLLHIVPKEYLETILDYCLNEPTNPSSSSPSLETAQSLPIPHPDMKLDTALDNITEEKCVARSSEASIEQVPAVHSPLNVCPEIERPLFDTAVRPVMSPILYTPAEKLAQEFEASLETVQTSSNQSAIDDQLSFSSTPPLAPTLYRDRDPDPEDGDDEYDEDNITNDDGQKEEECLVKSNYCENFFTLDRQQFPSARDQQPKAIVTGCGRDEDTLGEDYEIISDSELELLTSKRHI